MIEIKPLEKDKIEKYGNIIKQKIIIKNIDEQYIEKQIKKSKYKIKIQDKYKFIQDANKFLKNEIEKDIDILIKSNLKVLIELYKKYQKNYPVLIANPQICKMTDEQKLMNYILRDIFDYDKIISNKNTGIAYEILEILNIKVCPYCNREYISTVTKNDTKIIRPDFDHFYSKTEYPLFSLSLYNLIPVCKICNLKKASKSFTYEKNLYPYKEGIEDFRVFLYEITDYNIKIERNIKNQKYKKFLENVDKLYLEEIYDESHRNEVKEIVMRKRSLEDLAIKKFNTRLETEIETDKSKIKEILGYVQKEEIKNTSLGKLTNDIIDSLFE